jgi:glucokinase
MTHNGASWTPSCVPRPRRSVLVLGLDFGGTKLAAGVVRADTGRVVSFSAIPSPADAGAEACLAAMITLGRDVSDELEVASRIEAIGVSFGGWVALDGRTVRTSIHVAGWEGVRLAERLEETFRRPTRIANDADGAALAEFAYGAGRGSNGDLMYVTVSTGIGSGVLVGGRLVRGKQGFAGEIGHLPMLRDGPPCDCGRAGCLESVASGRGIARIARSLGAIDGTTAADVAAAAARGDQLLGPIWWDAMDWLGRAVASAANLLDPELIVIGGGLTRSGSLLFEPVQRAVARFAVDRSVRVLRAALGDHVGVAAGAALWHTAERPEPGID